jgi:nucleoside-diphosphate-sugar epimerase
MNRLVRKNLVLNAGAERLSVVKCDLTDSQGVDLGNRGVDVVVHAAAAMRGTLGKQLADTVTGTVNLLQAAREGGDPPNRRPE